MQTTRRASLSLGILLFIAAATPGCRCGGNDEDAGADGSVNLMSTNTIVSLTTSVPGIDQLFLQIVLVDIQLMEGECDYVGNMYSGYIPMTVVADLVLDCPNNPFNCPTFTLNWAGTETTSSLGGLRFSGIGDINCQVNINIDGLSAGTVVASAYTEDAFANYGLNLGPRELVILCPPGLMPPPPGTIPPDCM